MPSVGWKHIDMIERNYIERRFRNEGIYDLLRKNKDQWSKFNLVEAYRIRLQRFGHPAFNDFLVDNGIKPSALYAEVGNDCLVLWHATQQRHIDNIIKFGLFHHEGVFFAPPTFGLPFHLADGIPAKDKKMSDRLVVFACLFDTSQFQEGRDFIPGSNEYRFASRISPDVIFLVLTSDSVKCVGETINDADQVSPVEFVRRGKDWSVPTQNPCHFGRGSFYSTPDEWLDLYLDFIFRRNDKITLMELVNGIYMNISPMAAIPLEDIIRHICQKCYRSGKIQSNLLLKKTTTNNQINAD